MIWKALALLPLLGGCGVAQQPESLRTVAAYEIPLPTVKDKATFMALLRAEAQTQGFHVYASTPAEMEAQSEVSPITFNAAVWRGDDEEVIASAMDFQDHLGRVWILFSIGENPSRSARFRGALISKTKNIWPETASLPIMPNGSIPLTDDLSHTTSGYTVKPAAASKYDDEPR
ncbi:hypothetical protein U1701_00690 [Sphingomonas sp. PB2P19]|uniref:hypothetical protein n=1 Tax=Sphingomonas rhamnosi TaxID=3096156 RepID=UPI002FC9A57E